MKTYIAISVLFLMSTVNVSGIVIRHDVDDQKYENLGDKYSSSVAYINGCATTLIAPDWLLTAAHCVHQRKDRLFYANHLGRDYRIHSVVVYPEYGLSEESRHDVALIQLKKNVNDGNLVKLYSQKNEQGQLVVFVGKGKFGNGREGYIEYDGKQRGATNKIIGVDQHWIEFKFDGGDNATELEGISGSGDSGGPAFITSGTDLFVAGVSSYQELNGYDKATYGVSEFYARVSSYTEWIHSVIENAEVATPVSSHPIIDAIISDNAQTLSEELTADVLADEEIISEAFFQSIFLNRVSLGEQMIAQGVDLKSVEINGNSPFMLSFLAEREDYLKMLILNHQHLENIHPTDSEILPALVSVFGRSPEILEPINILLNQGANINAQTRQGDTAIILAGWLTDNIDLIKLLVKRGADVNIPNVNGDTPLIDAAYKGKNDILKILLDNGADITVKNNSGLSALDMARKTENTDAIEMLEEKSETKK